MNRWEGTRKEHETPTPESVRKRIEAWLAQPQVRSADHTRDEGAWRLDEPSLVVADATSDLYGIIADLVKARFEGDADGDRPILVALMDWTRQHRLDLPYRPRKAAATLPERFRALAALYDHVEAMLRECKSINGEIYASVRHCGELPDDECPGRSLGDARIHCDCYAKGQRCCHCAFMKPAEASPPAQEQK